MKLVLAACLGASIAICGAYAQDSPKIALKKGVSVQMPVAGHAVEMAAADEPDAMVVAITAEGKVYAGIKPTEPAALGNLSEATVYLKADARAPYQTVLAVLDGLHGKSVVLLTAPPPNPAKKGMVSPYGLKLTVSR